MTVAPERARRGGIATALRPELTVAARDGVRTTAWLPRLARRLFLLDSVLVAVAISTAAVVRFGLAAPSAQVKGTIDVLPVTSYTALCISLVGAWLMLLHVARTYDARVIGVGADEYKRVVRSSLWLWGAVAIVCYAGRVEIARSFFALAFPLGMLLLLLGRWGARKALHRARLHSQDWSHRVLVVGGVKEVDELAIEFGREPYAGLHVVGACVPGGYDGAEPSVPVVGSLTSVVQAVARTGADTVAVTASHGVTSSVLKRLGWELEDVGVDIVVAPALTDVAGPRVHVRPVSGLSLLYVEQPEFAGPSRFIKEVFDRLAAAVGLLVTLPLFLLIAGMIKITTPGPVIFRQVRVGREGRSFTVYKFRSMVADAEDRLHELLQINDSDGALFKVRDDPRITTVGRWLRRFSLDELPQLVNVLLGDMSLVGPRPALPSETEEYGRSVRRRLLVKPGITGLWQVSGRSDLSWEDSVRLDLYYVENWSFTGDIQILWKTVYAVATSRGAY
jgi:exopolysaccharide biosynthesis polyprenyl glycosylphosphotransferase